MDIGTLRSALSSEDIVSEIPVIPTGIYSVDNLLGGGVPIGKTVSIIGKGGSGKSTLLYGILHNTIRLGGVPILIDPEFAYFDKRLQELGYGNLSNHLLLFHKVSVDELFSQFKTIAEVLVKQPGYRFAVLAIDTFSDLPSDQEMSSGTPGIGIHARFASLFFRNALDIMDKFNITVIFICHEKTKISTFPGGGAVGYGYIAQNAIYANSFQEMRMTRTSQIKSGTNSVGFKTKLHIRKNKLAPPYQEVVLDYYYQFGYDRASNIFDGLVLKGLASKTKGWYTLYSGEKLQLGTLRRDNVLLDKYEDLLINGVPNLVSEQDKISEATDILNSFVRLKLATLCASNNNEYELQNGDIVSIDQLINNEELLNQYRQVVSTVVSKEEIV